MVKFLEKEVYDFYSGLIDKVDQAFYKFKEEAPEGDAELYDGSRRLIKNELVNCRFNGADYDDYSESPLDESDKPRLRELLKTKELLKLLSTDNPLFHIKFLQDELMRCNVPGSSEFYGELGEVRQDLVLRIAELRECKYYTSIISKKPSADIFELARLDAENRRDVSRN